jgi:hypothetical protein
LSSAQTDIEDMKDLAGRGSWLDSIGVSGALPLSCMGLTRAPPRLADRVVDRVIKATGDATHG